MTYMKTQLTLCISGTLLLVGMSGCEKTPERPMNVVYILADDLGYGDVGCVVHAALCRMYGECPFPLLLDDRIAYGTYASPGKPGDHARRPTADAGGYLYVG